MKVKTVQFTFDNSECKALNFFTDIEMDYSTREAARLTSAIRSMNKMFPLNGQKKYSRRLYYHELYNLVLLCEHFITDTTVNEYLNNTAHRIKFRLAGLEQNFKNG